MNVRPLTPDDASRVTQLITERWGESRVVVHQIVYRPAELPGFVAEDGESWLGLVTYKLKRYDCEIVTLDSLRQGVGVGTALMGAVHRVAREAGCERVWLVTTNDNLKALGFYQKRGYRLVKVIPGEVERSRLIKPSIPSVGENGIRILDEIELELPIG